MAKHDHLVALFWVAVSIFICEESIRLDPGSLSNPGPGLIPLGSGLLLGGFGIVLFIRTFRARQEEKETVSKGGIRWQELALALISLIGYAFLLDYLGFLLITLIWMVFICRVGKVGWKKTFFISAVTTSLCYILFAHFLDIRFPQGVFLGF